MSLCIKIIDFDLFLINDQGMGEDKIYTCIFCGKESEKINVVRKETHYYSVRVETGQWEDEGEEAELGEYFCQNCNKKIDNDIFL